MKKTYIKPEFVTIELDIHTAILAGSLMRNDEEAPLTGGGDEYDSLSRENEFEWDDEI